MAIAKGTIVWRGDAGRPNNHYSISRIEGVTDDTALATLITALAAYSDCNVAKRIFNSITGMTDSEPGTDANVKVKALFTMRNPTNLHVVKYEFPAPKFTAIELGEEGNKLTAAVEAGILAAINTACATSYTALSSNVWEEA